MPYFKTKYQGSAPPIPPQKYITDYNVFGNSVQDGTPTPDNPIEINSVGKKEGKLLIRTGGKNWFNINSPLKNVAAVYGILSNIENGFRNTITTVASAQRIEVRISNVLKINNTYKISYKSNSALYNVVVHEIPTLGGTLGTRLSTTSTFNNTSTPYLAILFYITPLTTIGATFDLWDIQIEEGTIATEFEPFIQAITEIPLTEPLRSTPNGTKNNLDSRNISPVILNGIEVWNSVTQSTANIDYYYIYSIMLDNYSLRPLAISPVPIINCDRLKVINHMISSTVVNTDTISLTTGTSALRMMIKKERIDVIEGATLLDKLKRWLSLNPITIEYPLLNPVMQNITRPKIPYFGYPPILLNEVTGIIEYTLDGITYSDKPQQRNLIKRDFKTINEWE